VKLAVIFHRFGPYHCARLEAASSRCELAGIELGAETREYQWTKIEEAAGFQRITLFPEGDSRLSPVKELRKRVHDSLASVRPEVVAIPGWSDKGALVALQWCVENKVPAILVSESTRTDEPRVWWKEWVKKRIVALYSSALVGGERHKEYLVNLGMPEERIFTGYDAVDNVYFAQGAKEGGSRKAKIEINLPGNYFLASARFIPKKNLDTLIRAYSEYRKHASASVLRPPTSDLWHLVILGDGPLRSDLSSLIADLGLQSYVTMPGFKQYDELPTYYGLAKAFVHASTTEQWGLVVNEAMASGLPVIVSNRCGCAPDLVKDGINGFTFDPSDKTQLMSRLAAMSALSLGEREKMSEASQEIVQQFAPEKFGEGLENAAAYALSHAPKHHGLVSRLLLNRVLSR
jgi:glycosyltransferase involved in cell wall biosynthesis